MYQRIPSESNINCWYLPHSSLPCSRTYFATASSVVVRPTVDTKYPSVHSSPPHNFSFTSGCSANIRRAGHTFYCPDNFTGRMAWRRLDQKVSVIFIQTNFDKSDPVITFAYALAYLHERFLYRLCKYRPTVFCWAHKVVKKIAHIVRSMPLIS